MRRPISRALTPMLCLALWSLAAGAQDDRAAIEAMRAQVQANRQALVAENLPLSPAESEAFWPLYREYRTEMSGLGDSRLALLTEFRDNYDGLSEQRAQQILDDAFQLEEDMLRLRKKYLPPFRQLLSQKQTLRYLQIENKLDTIVEYDLASVVPLAE